MAPYRKVANRIAQEARTQAVDAIVLGSHRHRRLGRLFSARVRARTTRFTPLPILTAPPPLDVGARSHLSVDDVVRAKLGAEVVTLSRQ